MRDEPIIITIKSHQKGSTFMSLFYREGNTTGTSFIRKSKKILILGGMAVTLVLGATLASSQSVEAAGTVRNIVIKEGKRNAKSIQLDGQGAKEKIYYTEKKTLNKNMSVGYAQYYDIETTVYINNKQVFKKKLKGVSGFNSTELIITDISTKDKVKDILIGNHYLSWCGDYQYLYHYQYRNKKLSKADDVLNTLKKLQDKTPQNPWSDWPYEVCCADSIKTMADNFVTTGDGKIETAVCIAPRNGGSDWLGFAHGTTYLKLDKNNKLVPVDRMPAGTIEIVGNNVSSKRPTTLVIKTDNGKKITGYKSPGDKKSYLKIASGSTVKILAYKYSGKKLYIQIKTTSGKKCWIDANDKHIRSESKGSLHA